MSRHYHNHIASLPLQVLGRHLPDRRQAMTLVEILIAVTLMTIIMLAVVRILSHVSNTLHISENAMVIAGRARATQMQIEKDLGCITAPLTPPLRFADGQGYFCIIEGLGSHYGNLYHDNKIGWELDDIAANENGELDSTVGDCDDIIMFTARAPGESMFRGLVGGKMAESKEAEICYFLRGTTLYRRVLLIIPNEQLQAALDNTNYTTGNYPANAGYGFYRDFDVSARLEWDDDANDWRVKANTLEDLTRRENRFGHAMRPLNTTSTSTAFPFPYGLHNNAAWYQLRLPTLAECTLDKGGSWRMGTQIVTTSGQYDRLVSQLTYDGGINDDWDNNTVDKFPKAAGKPYIDFWDYPMPWNGKSALASQTNALTIASGMYDNESTSKDSFVFKQRTNEDVLMTNVIGFDVKVWASDYEYWDADNNEWVSSPGFIDLGQNRNENGYRFTVTNNIDDNLAEARNFAKNLSSQGFYGISDETSLKCYADPDRSTRVYGLLPAVYDTWTDAYENDATNSVIDVNGNALEGIATSFNPRYDGIADIAEHVDEWQCPPPYTTPLTGLQIKIRVFDPGTNNTRDVTIRKSFK